MHQKLYKEQVKNEYEELTMVTYPIFFHHLSTTTITGSTAQLHYGK
jgi:hypothetical protein